MSTKTLGRLEKVQIRDIWPGEATDFTPWLAIDENLALLAEAIGIELEFEAMEEYVGPFRADIICKEAATENRVVIENQYGKTDHSHLGQAITYAAGLEAVTLVWIAERFTEEHRAAMDWLNLHTNDKINLFGLEIELWRIGNSLAAPKFNIVSQPNDWTKAVQKAAGTNELTLVDRTRLKFWSEFKKYVESRGSFLKLPQPYHTRHMNLMPIRSGVILNALLLTYSKMRQSESPEINAGLYLSGPNAREMFDALMKDQTKLESELGSPLIWHNSYGKSCSIFAWNETDFQDEKQWQNQIEWLRVKLEKLYHVFGPVVKSFTLPLTPISIDT